MTGPFRVDQATLATAASDVRSTRTEVDGQLKSLQGNVQELGSAWKGQAATGFSNLMQRWDTDVKKLLTAMDEIADLLDKSGNVHASNDEQQNSMFNQFNSAVNP
ncbi:hypothetical protein Aph02nite_40850 [Actinoplanes philippinensis]|uniref:ESAT-6-like protein n=1 Tax=Actinoplanes philippinensis TaxID=35752 RepID=A0A1I2GTZ3_9ACTN|nr:WXG100 family type VII secretion target [Actinoplanes philippinensis]GIE78135.1 hypothetical protein Aph02nite_40850 [Actinoplanes philippinensis]SFF21404.1 WXG100 family type VII secretion target [Actinoplanes philippinensis]